MNIRSPVVTILGHVDHGKTTLLDYIRKTKLANKEFGGITQKIGAYEVKTNISGYKNEKITFIDTPGHEAFSKLRSRGANVADLSLLIIDAKDGIMPQTIESISHIKAAKIPFIVVLNKIDLPDADPEKVKLQLGKYGVLVEGKGGKIPVVEISAKTGAGVNDLLESILLLSNELNLTYNAKNPPLGYIIETKKDKRGIVTSVILKDGQLKIGDVIYCKDNQAKIRSLVNDLGMRLEIVYPSTPFELLGFEKQPEVGSLIGDKKISEEKQNIITSLPYYNIDNLLSSQEEKKQLSLIIKADSQGSLDALEQSLLKNKNLEIILKGVGEITKSDIFLAKTTKAIIVGFNIPLSKEIKEMADQEKVIIKTYHLIYELIEELAEVSQLLKEKQEKEKNLKGEAKILANFIIDGEKVYGIKVIRGKFNLGDQIEVFRNGKLLGKTKLVSLKIRAKKINEVKKEQEAGMIFDPTLDITIGDVIKSIL